MNFIKQFPKAVIGNILFLIYIVIASVGGIIFRRLDPSWAGMEDVRMKYDLFFGGGLSTLCIAVIIGLLLRKEWGRQLSLSVSFILFFSHFIIRLGLYIFTKLSYGEGTAVIDLDAILISILSLTFLVLLTRTKTKEFYQRK